jgi:hypothetical protein
MPGFGARWFCQRWGNFAAAGKLAMLLRKRYADGYALLEDLESEPSRVETRIVYRDSERMRKNAVYGSVAIRFGKYRGRVCVKRPPIT